MLEPAWVQARLLGVGKFTVTRYNHDFLAPIAGQKRPVTPLFPAHFSPGLDVPAVNDHVAVSVALEMGNHFLAKPHLRGPETREALAAEHVPA
jgi:hypothetical protein